MKVNGKEYNIDELIKNIDSFDTLKDCGNGIYLTSNQIALLERNEIDYKKFNNVASLINYIDECLMDSLEEDDELEMLLEDLAERNYYENTNK